MSIKNRGKKPLVRKDLRHIWATFQFIFLSLFFDCLKAEFECVAAIMSRGKEHRCGAAILNKYSVITSTSCLKNKSPKDFYVAVGKTNYVNSEEKNFRVAKTVHTNLALVDAIDYNNRNFFGSAKNIKSISIIELNKPIEFNNDVRACNLELHDSEIPSGALRIPSWGCSSRSGLHGCHTISDELQVDRAYYRLEKEPCFEKYKRFNITIEREKVICVEDEEDKGVPVGALGSPVFHSKNGRDFTLFGIITSGRSCYNKVPSLATLLHAHKDWIISKLNKIIRSRKEI